jgi:hypothetical protein
MIRVSRLLFLAAPFLATLGLPGCALPPGGEVTALGPSTPGWTGRTVVPGNTSTVAGNAAATELQQKWPTGGRSD